MTRSLAVLVVLSAAGAARADVPAQGVELKVRRGFFTETDVGVFSTLGGQDGYGNATTYLQLGLGYDLARRLEVGLQVGIGASVENCYAQRDPVTGACSLVDSFSLTFLDASLAYLVPLGERLFLTPRLVGGLTLVDPSPTRPDRSTQIQLAANAGISLGIELATALDHVSVGADLAFRYVFGPGIASLALFPRLKYTF